MKFRKNLQLQKGHLDMTPLIDVIFLLLIFFMLSSSFVLQPGIEVDLPKAETSDVVERKNVLITISENKNIYLNDKITKIEKLAYQLEKLKDKAVILQADKSAPFEMVVNVWDICRRIGVEKLNIATNEKL